MSKANVREAAMVQDLNAALTDSPFRAVYNDEFNLIIINGACTPVAEVTSFLRSVIVTLPTQIGKISIELYPFEFKQLRKLLPLVNGGLAESLYLALYGDYSESMKLDRKHGLVQIKDYRIFPTFKSGKFHYYVNVQDQCYAMEEFNSLAVNLSLEEVTFGAAWPVFAI